MAMKSYVLDTTFVWPLLDRVLGPVLLVLLISGSIFSYQYVGIVTIMCLEILGTFRSVWK